MIHIAKPDAELLNALATAGVLDAQTAKALQPPKKGHRHKAAKPAAPKARGGCHRAKQTPPPQPIIARPLPSVTFSTDDLLAIMPAVWVVLAIGLILGLAIAQ